MEAPKLSVPAGTLITMLCSRVTIDFPSEEDASKFCDWLKWLDAQTERKELVLLPGEKPKVH